MRRFLGAEGGLGTMLGLSDDFMARVVRLVGNYGGYSSGTCSP